MQFQPTDNNKNSQFTNLRKKRVIDIEWQIPKFEQYEFFKKRTRYCICIPVINEERQLKKQLAKMQPYSLQADIIICDGGSSDGTANKKFLKQNKVRALIVQKTPKGQGSQLRTGFSYALKQGYKGIIQIDGNNKDGIEAIPNFIKFLDGGYDYLQGSRFIKGGRAINTPLSRWIGVRLIASPVLTFASRHLYTDVTNGFRGYSKHYLLHPQTQPFRSIFNKYELNLYLTVRAAQLGLKTKEIPVSRKYPKGKIHTKISFIKGNVNFFLTVFKVAFGFYKLPRLKSRGNPSQVYDRFVLKCRGRL